MEAFAEASATKFGRQSDGVWTQRAFGPTLRMKSGSAALGVRVGRWRIAAVYLGDVETESDATVRDADYDPRAGRCLRNCDTPAHFSGRGRVYGAYALYNLPMVKGLFAEAGALMFRPEWQVTVSNWREGGKASNPVAPTITYQHSARWQLSPVVAIGYEVGQVAMIVRHFTSLNSHGDWINSVYRNATQAIVRYDF